MPCPQFVFHFVYLHFSTLKHFCPHVCPCFALYLLILLRARLSILFCVIMIVSGVISFQVGGKASRGLIEHREQIGVITEDVMEIEVGYLFSL